MSEIHAKKKVAYYLTNKNKNFVDNTSKLIGITKSGYINLLISRNIDEN